MFRDQNANVNINFTFALFRVVSFRCMRTGIQYSLFGFDDGVFFNEFKLTMSFKHGTEVIIIFHFQINSLFLDNE